MRLFFYISFWLVGQDSKFGMMMMSIAQDDSYDFSWPARYEIVRPHQLAIVHQLLYESFYVDEPMTRHLDICQVQYSTPQFILIFFLNKIQKP